MHSEKIVKIIRSIDSIVYRATYNDVDIIKHHYNIYDIANLLMPKREYIDDLNFRSKLFISHVLIDVPENMYYCNKLLHRISKFTNDNTYFMHNGYLTNKGGTDDSLYAESNFQKVLNCTVSNANNIYTGKYIFGTYVNKKGNIDCALINIDTNNNKINAKTINKTYVIDFIDVYLFYAGGTEHYLENPYFVPFIDIHCKNTLLYNCENLNKSSLIKLNETISYDYYKNIIKTSKKDYLNNFHVINKYSDQNKSESLNLLDTYFIKSEENILTIKPYMFGHLVNNDSILCNVNTIFNRNNHYETNIKINKLKIFFDHVTKNKIPKIYEMIESELIEDILELTNLCDYFHIKIYLDYFKNIIQNEYFMNLFLCG
jgi:hypothetical protein